MNTSAILIGLALGLGLGVAASATGSPVLLRTSEAVEPLGQIGLGGKPVVGHQLAGQDGVTKRLGDLGGQIARLILLVFFHLSYI